MAPIKIRHRLNQLQSLEGLEPSYGAEIDLRSHVLETGAIHLSHDPWTLGDSLELWLKRWAEGPKLALRGPLILNTKEDGLESRAIELLERYSISNYFFLDTTLPTLVNRFIKNKNTKVAVRVSAYEPRAQIEHFVGKADWAWVDCFGGIPLPFDFYGKWLLERFKVCLVSPELQGVAYETIRADLENPSSDWALWFKNATAICSKL